MVKFHGNYCGPNWSAGLVQRSVVSDVPATDEFDETCKQHDAAYATGQDRKDADLKFASQNLFRGIKPTIAGVLVGAQGLLRSHDKPDNKQLIDLDPSQPLPATLLQAANMRRNAPTPLPTMIPGRGSQPKMQPPKKVVQRVSGLRSVVAPVAFSRRVAMQRPTFNNKGVTSIKHREYIGTIANSTSFTTTAYGLNPGLPNVFPWLSNIAANFDKYKFKSLRFDYVPAVSTSTNGRITLAFNYNAGDSAPTSKQQVFSIAPNAEQAVWAELSLPVPVIPETLYTREYLVPGSDIKTFDMGQLLVSTDLGSNSNTIGELYVEYEVHLEKPHPQFVTTTEVYNITTSTISNIFPTTGGTVYLNSGVWSSSSVANSLTCALSGRYMIVFQLSGTVLSAANLTATEGTITDFGSGETVIVNTAATKLESIGIYDVVVDSSTKKATILLTPTGTTVIKFMFWASILDANTTYNDNT